MQLGYCNSLISQNRPRGAAFVGALDGYTTDLLGAWSVARRLLGSYSGALGRVRRSSDSTELDIGIDADGNLDTAALLAFAGAGDAHWRYIYDQSGQGNHAQQATAASQYQAVASGSLLTCGLLPCGVADGGDDFMLIDNLVNLDVAAYSAIIRSEGATWNTYGAFLGTSVGVTPSNEGRLGLMSAGTTEWWYDLFPEAVRQNGVALSSPFAMSSVNSSMVVGVDCHIASQSSPLTFGNTEGIFFLNYRKSELVAWGTVADRSAFEANQMALIGL